MAKNKFKTFEDDLVAGALAHALSERDRARKTAVLLEQALAAAEADIDLATQKIEELSDENQRLDDALIKTELAYDAEVAELRGNVDWWRGRSSELERKLIDAKDKSGDASGKFVETVADLTLNHVGATVSVHIDGRFTVTDRLVAIEFRQSYDFTTAVVTFETAGRSDAAGRQAGFAVDLHQRAAVVEPAAEAVPF